MEIFQTIWTALTTENENLIIPISFFLSLIESYVSVLLFTTVLNVSSTKKQNIIYVFVMTICSFVTKYLIPNPYNTFINIIVVFVSTLLIFKISILKGLLAIVVPFVTVMIIESIFSKIYYSIFHINYLLGINIPLHRIFGTFFIYSIMYSIHLILKYYKLNFQKFDVINKRKKILLILNVIFSIVLIGIQLYLIYFYSSFLPFIIILVSLVSLLTYVLISLYTTFAVSKLETTSTNLEEAQLYNKTLEILQDNTRAFRHDFANIIQGMVGYIDNNDMEGLKSYYSQLVEDIQHTNNLTTLSPKVVNNPAIYNVLASKYHKADSLGIKINLEVFLDLNDLHMKIYEFTRILGILMDNAIEAASECENKIINVSIRKNNKKHMQLLQIENTYKNKEIDTDKIFEKGYSTKEGNTGLGLWEIRQILNKNNNLNLYTSKDERYFSQQLEIYY